MNDEQVRDDAVDRIVGQWRSERPELRLRPMEVFGRIHRLSRLTLQRIEPVYLKYGIGRAEFDVIASIRRSGEPYTLSPKQIGATLMLSSGGLTGRLDKLEKAGLVERLPDPDDRRGLRVRVTGAGLEAVDRAVAEGLDVQAETLDTLTVAEQETLAGLLRKLHNGFLDEEIA
ncbi:MarR family winged helix-turn-helix transcriptional regulator [Phytomonospora endophytica]|uniref:DNA-binding MarR family transcriptional regulator n=1 Tax=Phytomonospora endophytica TaxID=714109 RepID=A0A841FTP5_9ACTN|nr:MarR family transcriptional regulator [Phytomonospora endophytica]MBB6039396.1 DNA-binding MarR family transcriptional regulator [Phytomonospora endophytica]GIG70123.1 MarR family transcriptional regulator [Phytomonospora endophytica]